AMHVGSVPEVESSCIVFVTDSTSVPFVKPDRLPPGRVLLCRVLIAADPTVDRLDRNEPCTPLAIGLDLTGPYRLHDRSLRETGLLHDIRGPNVLPFGCGVADVPLRHHGGYLLAPCALSVRAG